MKLIYIILLPITVLFAHKGFSQNGGGIYVESGAKVIGCVIAGNKAAGDGSGVCGGDAELLNCTVGNNVPAEKLTKTIDIGYIFCEDNSIVSKETYETEGRTNAAGVVFWLNSDRYARTSRAYVVALKQAEKVRGEFSVNGDVEFAMFDTACYMETIALAAVSEAAIYCREYMKGSVLEGRWLMPAGFQLSCLFTTHVRVQETLEFLRNKGMDVDFFEKDVYWCTSEANIDFWGVSFTSEIGYSHTPGKGFEVPGDEQHWVRPILIY